MSFTVPNTFTAVTGLISAAPHNSNWSTLAAYLNAASSANNVVINDSSGNLSSEAQLAVSRGGTGLASYTTGDLLYASSGSVVAKLAVGTSSQVVLGGTTPSYGQVPTGAIANSAVTTVKIADANVTTAKIADSNVTTAKILDANVTTAKIADGAVTQAKRATLGQQISSSSLGFSSSSSSLADVTSLSVSITTTGRPVQLMLVSDGNGSNTSYVSSSNGALTFDRGGTEIARQTPASNGGPVSGYAHLDPVGAGTYTYKARIICFGGASISVQYAKLVAYEL